MRKISIPERAAVLITGVFLAFSLGWLARGSSETPPVHIETERTPGVEEQTVTPTAALPPSQTPAAKVNINRAGEEELQRLPGIGEKRAADIVADRAANGPFLSPRDLLRVPGIGEGTLEGLMELITVEEETDHEDTGSGR